MYQRETGEVGRGLVGFQDGERETKTPTVDGTDCGRGSASPRHLLTDNSTNSSQSVVLCARGGGCPLSAEPTTHAFNEKTFKPFSE